MDDISELLRAMSNDEKNRDAACTQFSKMYFEKLSGWASQRLHPALVAIVDPDEIANSVCRTVMDRIEKDPERFSRFMLEREPDKALYHVLMQKLYERGVYHLRAKRDPRLSIHIGALEEGAAIRDASTANSKSGSFFDVVWPDTLEAFMTRLNSVDRTIIDGLLEGKALSTISRENGYCSRWASMRLKRHILPIACKFWPDEAGRSTDEEQDYER